MTDSDVTPSPTHCINCGTEVLEHAQFCQACGSSVYRPEAEAQPSEPAPVESPPSETRIDTEPNSREPLYGEDAYAATEPVSECGPDGVWRMVGSGEIDRDEILQRLEKYVGPNWKSHYQKAFSRLLDQKLGGASTGLMWNWSAALFSGFWCLKRRLWGWFFVCWFMVTILNVIEMVGGPPLIWLNFIFFGLLGDRLFFSKAFANVQSKTGRHDDNIDAPDGQNKV